jgi:Domain of unknown function (DUF3859)
MGHRATTAAMLATFVLATPSHAQPQELQPSCEILDFGLIERYGNESSVRGGDTATGTYTRVQRADFPEDSTSLIPATLGIDFGVARSFKNIPKSGIVELVISHPAIVTPDGRRLTKSVIPTSPTAFGNSYRFDQPYEVVPGEWTFEFFYEGVRLCGKAFHVIDLKGN